MKLFLGAIFIFILPFSVFAQDYDSFILNYQSVKVNDDKVCVEFVLEKPKEYKIDTVLKNGAILKLVFDTKLSKKKFFRNERLTAFSLSYYLRYDPLTRQYTAMQESKTIARNADVDFLLNILIQHVTMEIPCKLKKGATYLVHTQVDLFQSNARTWFGTKAVVKPDRIIQPVEFDYEFSL